MGQIDLVGEERRHRLVAIQQHLHPTGLTGHGQPGDLSKWATANDMGDQPVEIRPWTGSEGGDRGA